MLDETSIYKDMNYYKNVRNAWMQVKRITKKDGSNFSSLSRNFKGCTFTGDEVTVYLQGSYDSFYLNCPVSYMKKEDIKHDAVGRMYYFDADEIFDKIEKTIIKYNNIIESLENQLNSLDYRKQLMEEKTKELYNFCVENNIGTYDAIDYIKKNIKSYSVE